MKIFLDTSPFIYLIENNSEFVDKVRTFILDALANDDEMVTSVITVMEFGVMPIRKGRQELILQFEEFLDLMNVGVESINPNIAKTAYTLRAQYDFLKGMDALQISVAIEKDCQQFLTNDRKLRRISEIDVILVEDI